MTPSNTSRVLISIASIVVVLAGLFALRSITRDSDNDTTPAINQVDRTPKETNAVLKARIQAARENTEPRPTPRVTGRKVDLSTTNTIDESERDAMILANADYTSYTMPDAMETSDVFGFSANPRSVEELDKLFRAEKDPNMRIMLAFELSTLDTPEAVNKILELAQLESDGEVVQMLLQGLIGSASVEGMRPETLAMLLKIRENHADPTVRASLQDIIGEMGTPESVATLKQWYGEENSAPIDRISAAENLLRSITIDPTLLNETEVAAIYSDLQSTYRSSTDQMEKAQALMALAYGGRAQLEFLQQIANTEQDLGLRDMAERMVKMFSGEGTYGIDPRMTPTPVPTPPQE